jgi:tetratricopeptide (TPR) repeat protein
MFLVLCVSCSATGNLQSGEQAVEAENETTDPGCAYFYFLWGKSAENDYRYEEALQAYKKVLVCDPDSEAVFRDIAVLLIKMDKKKEAIDWLDKIVARNPADIENRQMQAKLYTSLGDFETATTLYNQILSIKEDENTLLMLGSLYAQLKEYDKAQEYLERLIKLDQQSYMAHYYLARLYREVGFFSKALTTYEETLAINWSTRLAFEIAEFYEEQGSFAEAGKMYRRVLEEDETDEVARTRLINVYLQMDEVETALLELKKMKVFASEPEKVDFSISRLLIAKERYDEAVAVLSQMIADNPDHYSAAYLLALTYHYQEETGKSKELLQTIPPSAEVYEDAVLLLARTLKAEEDLPASIQLLRKAIADKTSRKESFYVVLASLLSDSGEEEKGAAVFNEALAFYPDNNTLRFEYGMFLERIGDQDGAMKNIEQVLEADPQNPAALNYIGYTWADKGVNLEKALSYIEQAVALKPEDGFIRDSLGWVYFRLGEIDRAIKELEMALALVEDDPVIFDHAGDVYLAAGQPERAKILYEKALDLFEDAEKKKEVEFKLQQIKEEK